MASMRILVTASLAAVAFVVSAAPAVAQQTVADVLSFLLTNRSIPTGDFVQDARAAAATRDTISTFLLVELATLPVTSSASGTVPRSLSKYAPSASIVSCAVERGARWARKSFSFNGPALAM